MRLHLFRWIAPMLGLAVALLACSARADTAVKLTQSYAGNLNFVGTQVTMRNKSNKDNPCSVYESTAQLPAKLSGIPADATIVSAQLYWAGSNGAAKPDYTVTFEGSDVSAPAARQYASATIGSGYNYFGGAADVTAQVASKRNGDYTFSGLTIANGRPYCSVEGVLGGFSLLVIYSSPAEPLRVLNLYEGFQYFRYSGITINLSNFQVPKPLPDNVTARLAHITWEGDTTLQKKGEELMFNKVEMNDSLNPKGNQFNSASNINGATLSYGIDFDAYTIKPSSGLIWAGQTKATTRYQSGQDMVLLNAEIIAMPNGPTSDLSITMSRSGELQVGRSTTYNLVVGNAGPSVESGPVTVTDTLPSGVTFVSASASGWTCSASGQVVTCTIPGPLAVGATLPAIALRVRASAAGTYTNTATVTGKMFDNISANNTVTDTSRAAAAGTMSYVFTRIPCPPETQVGGLICPQFVGPVTAGAGTPAQIYVTAVSFDSTGLAIATPLSTTAATDLPLRFALSCLDPGTGTLGAVFAEVSLPVCSDPANPAWSAWKNLKFDANKPSSAANFIYEDVGKVALNVIDGKGQAASTTFVVRPHRLEFRYVVRSRDDGALPAREKTGTIGFAKAGEAFTLAVGAKTSSDLTEPGKNWAPNFGRELSGTIGPMIRLELGAGNDAADFDSGGGNGFTSASDGAVIGTDFTWNQVGVLKLTPMLGDYLGTDPQVGGVTKDIGRFYPDHFETTTESSFACVKHMACPETVTGAVYSGQTFPVIVKAYGMAGVLNDYTATVTLRAYDAPGGLNLNPGGPATYTEATAPLQPGKVDIVELGTVRADVRYTLASPFKTNAPRLRDWTKPTAVYLRASVRQPVVKDKTGAIDNDYEVTSKDIPAEGGVMVVNGRLQLANAFGSELLKLPVRMSAQYWTGAAWENNIEDSSSVIGKNLQFSDCKKRLVGSGTPCNLALLKTAAEPAALAKGAGTIWLAAPGAGNAGSALLQAGDPPWLPSTQARAVFGIYKSPLIYIREVY
jgi:MSHA biogenesis protein MshQ